jgi:hypothetical protein
MKLECCDVQRKDLTARCTKQRISFEEVEELIFTEGRSGSSMQNVISCHVTKMKDTLAVEWCYISDKMHRSASAFLA